MDKAGEYGAAAAEYGQQAAGQAKDAAVDYGQAAGEAVSSAMGTAREVAAGEAPAATHGGACCAALGWHTYMKVHVIEMRDLDPACPKSSWRKACADHLKCKQAPPTRPVR